MDKPIETVRPHAKADEVIQSALIRPLGGYVAIYRMTTQMGPCDYEVTPICKVITADTTIGELLEWYQLRCPGGKAYFEIVEAT